MPCRIKFLVVPLNRWFTLPILWCFLVWVWFCFGSLNIFIICKSGGLNPQFYVIPRTVFIIGAGPYAIWDLKHCIHFYCLPQICLNLYFTIIVTHLRVKTWERRQIGSSSAESCIYMQESLNQRYKDMC